MARWRLILAVAVTVPTVAAVARPLPPGAYQINVAKSCQSWFSDCASRCRSRAPGDPSCIPGICSPRLAACRRSGCWQEPTGNGLHCGLVR